jgi:transposase-like protein
MNAPVIQSKNTRRKFDKTFKQQAVELWLNSGKAATEVAAELGVHAQRLSAWRKRFAPSNWKPKMPVCGARTTICANSGTF